MTAWEVKDCLSHLTVWDETEENEILSMCKASLKEVEAMLSSDADRSDARIASAAACDAYYKLTIKRSFASEDSEVTNFKAGDVSITQNSKDRTKELSNAEKLYERAFKNIIPLCQDNGFAFENVKIKVML